MKSNEEFISGIYEKARIYQDTTEKSTKDNMIPIHSFGHRIKKYSAYAAGVAACILCSILILDDHNAAQTGDRNQAREARDLEGQEAVPLSIEQDSSDVEQNRAAHWIDATILDVVQEENSCRIQFELCDETKSQGTLVVTQEKILDWQQIGKELLLSVYESDSEGVYSMVPDSVVYEYQTTENGQKVFGSKDGTTIKESEIR